MLKPAPDPSRESIYQTVRGRTFKSCPKCSEREGQPVFHSLEKFGDRRTQSGTIVIQAWCGNCRSRASKIALKRRGA